MNRAAARFAAAIRAPICAICFGPMRCSAPILNTHHNLYFFLDIMRSIREAIAFGNCPGSPPSCKRDWKQANHSGVATIRAGSREGLPGVKSREGKVRSAGRCTWQECFSYVVVTVRS